MERKRLFLAGMPSESYQSKRSNLLIISRDFGGIIPLTEGKFSWHNPVDFIRVNRELETIKFVTGLLKPKTAHYTRTDNKTLGRQVVRPLLSLAFTPLSRLYGWPERMFIRPDVAYGPCVVQPRCKWQSTILSSNICRTRLTFYFTQSMVDVWNELPG